MKIITCPDECAHRREDIPPDYQVCIHPKNMGGTCDCLSKFPYKCPLDEGPTLNRTATLKLLRKYLPNTLADHIISLIYA